MLIAEQAAFSGGSLRVIFPRHFHQRGMASKKSKKKQRKKQR